MKALLKSLILLPYQFCSVCWNKGIHQALALTWAKVFRNKLIPLISPETFPPRVPSNASAYLALLKHQPRISIVMPTYNSLWLKAAVDSVLAQTYRNFELILVNDGSTNPGSLKVIRGLQQNERVRIIDNTKNMGISAATNVGIDASHGEYIAFMDSDDLIHPDALAYFVRTLNNGYDPDIWFTDEVVINDHDVVVAHMKKCPISMDLLLSCNAVVHLCIMKRSALAKIGPLRPEYDGSQDHELMIRAAEHGLSFYHMPCYLYAWRTHMTSWSGEVRAHKQGAKQNMPKTYLNGKKAINDYLVRNGIRAVVTDDAFFWYRAKYSLPDNPDEVAIIVPFKDQVQHLKVLLKSMQLTSYNKYMLYLVNNRSEKPETLAYLEQLRRENNPRYRFVDIDEPFNYSLIHNRMAAMVPNEIMLFLNNDIEVFQPDWLEAMLEHIYRDNVAAVGCRLLRRNGTTQHASTIFYPNIYYCAINLRSHDGYYTDVQRDVSGVTAACMLIRRSIFQKVGGFDEVHFPIGFSDSDLCLKLIKNGYKIMYTPHAELYHHESSSRKTHGEGYEKFALFNRYIGETPMFDSHYKTV